MNRRRGVERVCAILPVKPFGDSKERLSTGLSGPQRQLIAEAMLRDVIAALGRTGEIDGLVVVTTDRRVSEICAASADAVVEDEMTGHSDAAITGAKWAIDHGFDRVVMLPGDCPLLEAGELDELVARTREDRIELAVVPDRMGTGTNALVISPPDAIAPAFGPGSRQRHIALGLAAARRTAEYEVPSLALDLDTEEDLLELAERIAGEDHQAINTEQALAEMIVDRGGLPGGYAR